MADAKGGKALVLGSRHQRPVLLVSSDIGSDAKLDETKAEAFLKNADGSPRYKASRYVPMFAAGADTTVDRAVEILKAFITTVDQMDRADTIKVESAKGETLYEGNAYSAFPRTADTNAQGEKLSPAARVLKYLQDAYKLAHQQELNTQLRAAMLADAEKAGVLAPTSKRASAGRASTDSKLI